MTSLMRGLALLAALGTLTALPARAQRVRGDVRQGDGTTPAPGIVIVANGTRGEMVARALSGSGGAFELQLPAGGTYTVRALRIGYRPTVVTGVVVAAAGVTSVRIVLAGAALPLATVSVRGADVCGAADDPQDGVVQVWSEARTALTAAALWSRELLDAEWITYRRELKPETDAVRAQEVHSTRSTTLHAFQSWNADSLAARGYAVPDGDGITYYAPDPDVLLSDSFADTHCFHLEPPAAGAPGLVGVGFGPQRSRGDRVEIAGTLWIDRASSELRWLEFHYIGLPAQAEPAMSGGRVEFLRLAEGPWIVSRWHIRMPQFGAPVRAGEAYQVTRLKEPGSALTGIIITGGMVAHVWRRGKPLYTPEGAGVGLQVVRTDTAVSVALPRVQLEGTDYDWRGDSTGRVQAGPVLEGRYEARISTPEMTSLDVSPVTQALEVTAAGTRVDRVALPTSREMIRDACGGDALKYGLGALYGTVRDSGGRLAAGRAVTVSWTGAIAGLPGGRVFSGRTTIGALTDEHGAWRLCEVPRDRAVAVRTAGDDGRAAVDVALGEWRWFAGVPLQVRAGVAGDADASAATLELLVRDKGGRALPAAALELSALGAERRRVTTDARGRALVTAFPPGIVTMRAKRTGYAPGEVVFAVAAGRNTVPVILDKTQKPSLDAVRVIGNHTGSSLLDGFETRRLHREATASFTREEIEQRSPAEISDLLRMVGAIKLADSSGVVVARLARGFRVGQDTNAQSCNMRVLLDGTMVTGGNGVNVVRPTEVLGLEVFASSSRPPVGLGITSVDAVCGLIAIWTGAR